MSMIFQELRLFLWKKKLPEFFEFAGNNINQILDIPTFYEVLTWERDTPGYFTCGMEILNFLQWH